MSSFQAHQEAPGDQDQVQLPAPPALFSSLNLPTPGLIPTSHCWEICPSWPTPLSPQTSPGSLHAHQLWSPWEFKAFACWIHPIPGEQEPCQ